MTHIGEEEDLASSPLLQAAFMLSIFRNKPLDRELNQARSMLDPVN